MAIGRRRPGSDMTQPPTARSTLRTVLICHHDAPLHHEGIARWLASWSTLAGVVVIREPRSVLWRRLRRERRRVGTARMLDVLAFRFFYRARYARADTAWLEEQLEQLRAGYPPATSAPRIEVASPNAAASQAFIEAARPDAVIALCKNILAERIFGIPRLGTFVLHPGICPEYRNAHGCFWALASDDLERVGMTLIRIDRGIDTGPVLGHFGVPFDEVNDTHIRIQHRAVLHNLDAIRSRLLAVAAGDTTPVDVRGRASREWGQPWLTAWWRWKRHAQRRRRARHRP
jgi:hypothetical protein